MDKTILLRRNGSSFEGIFLALLYLYAVYICFYGSLITFFAVNTQDIRDPQLPLGLRLLDETLLALMLFCVVVYRKRWMNERFRIVYLQIGLLLVIAAYMVFNLFPLLNNMPADNPMFIPKNFVYVAVVLLIVTIAATSGLFLRFLLFLQVAISFSLLIGIAYYFFMPGGLNQTFSSRLFGTYVNPNTAAFISIFNIVLAYSLYLSKLRPITWSLGSIAVSASALYLSGSLSALVMLIGVIVWVFLYRYMPLSEAQLALWRRRTLFVAVATLSGLTFAAIIGPSSLFERYVVKASGTYVRLVNPEVYMERSAPHDATFHRFDAYRELRESLHKENWTEILFGYTGDVWIRQDASFINMFRLVGLAGVLLFIVCLCAPLYIWLRRHILPRAIANQRFASRDALSWPMAGFTLIVVIFNFTTQYSLEEPPTNVLAFLAVFVITLMNPKVRMNRKAAA